MVTRTCFGPDGEPINRPAMTLAQEIAWCRSQIEWLRSLGNSESAARQVEVFNHVIASLQAGEVA